MATADTHDIPLDRDVATHDRTERDRIAEAERARHPGRARLARGARLIGAALIAAVIGYVAGRVHGALAVRAIESDLALSEAEHAEALAHGEQRIARIEERVAFAQQRIELLEGARRIGIAQRALDARNFGTAEQALREAERRLRPLEGSVEGLGSILSSLAATQIVVAEDLAAQREQLGSIAERTDALLTSIDDRLPPEEPAR